MLTVPASCFTLMQLCTSINNSFAHVDCLHALLYSLLFIFNIISSSSSFFLVVGGCIVARTPNRLLEGRCPLLSFNNRSAN